MKNHIHSISILLVLSSVLSCNTLNQLKIVSCSKAPKAIGPYSQAIEYSELIFLSGQIGINAESGELAADIQQQTIQVMDNIGYVLKEAGSDFRHVTKVTIYLSDMANYAIVNGIYEKYFSQNKPARSTVQVSALPKNALVEIECIAVKRSARR